MRSTLALFLTGAAALLMTSVTGGNAAAQTDPRPPQTTCETAATQWTEGANYKAGDGLISYSGLLWECKGGAATALCDDPGYEPDREPNRNRLASQAWQLVTDPKQDNAAIACVSPFVPQLVVDSVEVSSVTCKGTLAVVTLTATVRNDGPSNGDATIAFYHSDKKTLIAVEPIAFGNEDYEPQRISTVWRTSCAGSALITVVADDDGTGRDKYFETNPDDNMKAVKLPICPAPKPPGPPIEP